METPKKKKNSTIPRTSFWRRHYPLIIALISLVALYLYFLQFRLLTGVEYFSVLYPLIESGYLITGIISCLIVPITFLIFVIAVSKRGLWGNHTIVTMWSDFFASVIMVIITIFACVYFFAFFLFGDLYVHKDRLELNNQVYILSGHNTYDDLGYGNFVLYECDNRVLFCSKIYETNSGYDTGFPAELSFDGNTQAISIIINGEVVHTYQLEDQ